MANTKPENSSPSLVCEIASACTPERRALCCDLIKNCPTLPQPHPILIQREITNYSSATDEIED